jgi:hypothetical protein
MRFAAVALLISAMCLSGCISPLIKDSTALGPDEGIIAVSMRCGEGLHWALFFRSGVYSKGMLGGLNNSAGVECNDGPWTRVVKSGSYFMGQVGSQAALDFEEKDALSFSVEPQKVTYIGEIRVPSLRSSKDNTTFVGSISVVDRSAETLDYLKTNLPGITKKYPFVTSLISVPPAESVPTDQ